MQVIFTFFVPLIGADVFSREGGAVSEVEVTPLPRTLVNKGKDKGRG